MTQILFIRNKLNPLKQMSLNYLQNGHFPSLVFGRTLVIFSVSKRILLTLFLSSGGPPRMITVRELFRPEVAQIASALG